MTNMYSHALSESLAKNLLDKINVALDGSSQIYIIGIDGPTASGKSILARQLQELIKQKCNVNVVIFELDWTLTDRDYRKKILSELAGVDSEFRYESELHMRLNIAANFLAKVRNGVKDIQISNLYSREQNGCLNRVENFKIHDKSIVIVEGHYTLNPKISEYIDFNILLLGDKQVFLDRKINRVSSYRDSAQATEYYWRIDCPSFINHLTRFEANADLIIDNTDVFLPKFNRSIRENWLVFNSTHAEINSENAFSINKIVNSLDFTKYLDLDTIRSIERFFEVIRSIDNYIGKISQWNIGEIYKETIVVLDSIAREASCVNYLIQVASHDDYSRIHKKQFPINLLLNYKNDALNIQSYAHLEVDVKSLKIIFGWNGGGWLIDITRSLGNISQVEVVVHSKVIDTTYHSADRMCIFRPTSFIDLPFVSCHNSYELHYAESGPDFSLYDAIEESSNSDLIIIKKFALHQQSLDYVNLLNDIGLAALKLSNYVIALKTFNEKIQYEFHKFSKIWSSSHTVLDVFDQNAYDSNIRDEKNRANSEINACSLVKLSDNYLYCLSIPGVNNWSACVDELIDLLKSKNIVTRNFVINYLETNYPDLNIYLDEFEINGIPFNKYLRLYPSTFTDLYLWMSIKGESSSILASNIYDIRNDSIDVEANFTAANKYGCPIVLQCSLNAVGQQEIINYQNGNIAWGYLKPKSGVRSFLESVRQQAFRFYKLNGSVPFYSVGLDHINTENDIPVGRAARFLSECIQSGMVTHLVLDGTAKFQINHKSTENLAIAFSNVADWVINLLEGQDLNSNFDIELVASELNYSDDTKEAVVLSPMDMQIFSYIFKAKFRVGGLSQLNQIPWLYVGNLGTTHHGEDKSDPFVELAEKWQHKLSAHLLVTPVLHGTSGTKRDVLARASKGCKKINIAGNYAELYMKSLPKSLVSLVDMTRPAKYSFALINNKLDSLTDKERGSILESLEADIGKNINAMNSPRLCHDDLIYFSSRHNLFDNSGLDAVSCALKKLSEENGSRSTNTLFPTKGKIFCPSLIEVPYGSFYKELVSSFIKNGCNNFHIDVGDGKLVSRKFSALEKIEYLQSLKEYNPDIECHTHLMVEMPHVQNCDESKNTTYVEAYSKASSLIAVHQRAFVDNQAFIDCLRKIKEYKIGAGIVIELNQQIDIQFCRMIISNEIKHLIVMGVPIGFGGQSFHVRALSNIRKLHQLFLDEKYEIMIELDGGLTMNVLRQGLNSGAQMFAGWSLIKSDEIEDILVGYNNIMGVIDS